jgi:hypothetical protein
MIVRQIYCFVNPLLICERRPTRYMMRHQGFMHAVTLDSQELICVPGARDIDMLSKAPRWLPPGLTDRGLEGRYP